MATHEVTRPLALNVTALEIAQALQDIIVTLPVVDNLTTNDGSKALSAKMGKKLNDEKFPIANIASALGQDVDKVPSNKVVDDAINAISTSVPVVVSINDSDFTLVNNSSVYNPKLKLMIIDVSLTSSNITAKRKEPIIITAPTGFSWGHIRSISCVANETYQSHLSTPLGCFINNGTITIDRPDWATQYAEPRLFGILYG